VHHIYPDPSQTYLRRDIAAFLGAGVTPDMVCAGTGSDELLDLVLRLFDPAAIVNLPPTFGMYPFLGKIAKAGVINVDRGPAPHFGVDFAAVAAAVDAGASVVFAASPNNPTGGMLTHAEVRALCAASAGKAVVVVDEAYAEFAAPGASSAGLVAAHPNLIVMRTFSKWAGLAGLRVGYSVAAPVVNAALMSIKQPYNVNVAADVGARAALAHAGKIMATQVAPMLAERDRMTAALAGLGWLAPMPTSSNFVLFRVAAPYVAAEVVAGLRARGVLVRYYPSGRLAGYLRVSAGRPADTDRLLAVIADIGASQRAKHGAHLPTGPGTAGAPAAVIFDMDGVLVEVAGSYRAAILATAAHFGAAVTPSDVDALKAAGGANNDWVVSQRLVAAHSSRQGPAGRDASLEAVTSVFERLYQGDASAGDPGLKATESALIPTALLRALKARCPGGLAIVTGRPRKDCAEALARYGWEDGLFDAVVCMEDTPAPKPDPAPVQLALTRLREAYAARTAAAGAGGDVAAAAAAAALITPSSVVMLGDTVDDVRAAVAAGVGAVGVYPPDKAPAADASKAAALSKGLTASGAALLLQPGCAELLRLVPTPESEDELFTANALRVAEYRKRTGAPSSSSSASSGSNSSAGASASGAAAGGRTIGSGVGRVGSVSRATKETRIYAWVNLDGTGESDIRTGCVGVAAW
jgi:histidinol-phosphate aminotransferase